VLAAKQQLVLREIEEGTGAAISIEVDRSNRQTGLRLWFADLGRGRSPIVHLRPKGLKRYEASLAFGSFAADTVRQMMAADDEERQLARALVLSIARGAEVRCGNQELDSWQVDGPTFTITAERRSLDGRFSDDVLVETCRDLVTPMLAAMAELYGYDPVEPADDDDGPVLEGALSLALVRRRERNPRNRLLCLRVHGHRCGICQLDPTERYGPDVTILEVHHIQPLALKDGPAPYNPARDLLPLCPNCHRAVHSRRPVPWSPEELKSRLAEHD